MAHGAGHLDRFEADRIENLKAAFLYVEKGLFALTALNGGAIIVLLTYAGALLGKSAFVSDEALRISKYVLEWPVRCFAVGLTFTLCCYFSAYQAQLHYYRVGILYNDLQISERTGRVDAEKYQKASNAAGRWHAGSYALFALAVAAFALGSIISAESVRRSIAAIQAGH